MDFDFELDLDLDFESENQKIDNFNEDYFLTTHENFHTRFNLDTSIAKLKNNKIVPIEGESIRCISPANGWSSCSLLIALTENMNIEDLIITTLRVGQKELERVVRLKREGRLKNALFVLSGLSKENDKRYDYTSLFEKRCKELGFKYKYIKNHSKVILINSDKGKYIIETSSNFNENPKVEQFIISKSNEVYDFYIKVFRKIGIIDG